MSQRTGTDLDWTKEAYLKNGRVSIDMQITRFFTLFYQTDDLSVDSAYNKGEFTQTYGKKSNAAYTKDAYLHFDPAPQFQVYAGLLTVPINRANMMSDTGLLGTDNTAMHPEFGTFSHCGRDTGVMLRGILFGSILEYRMGIFEGLTKETNISSDGTVMTKNPSSLPRICGRLQVNGMDAEEGYFCDENYMSKREILSLGLGVDYQPDIYHSGKDYMSWAVDLPMNVQMMGMYTFCAQASLTYAQNYPDFTGETYNGYLNANVQAGILIADIYEPLIKFTYSSTHGDDKNYETFTFGFNYFIDGNKMNIKSSFDLPIGSNKNYPDQWKATLQCQLYM